MAVSVTKLDELLRITTDIMAIAQVNKYPAAMIMSCDVADEFNAVLDAINDVVDYAAANEPTSAPTEAPTQAPVDSAAKGKNQSSNKNGNQTAAVDTTTKEGD